MIKRKEIYEMFLGYIVNIMKKIEFELFRNEGVYVKLTAQEKDVVKKLARCRKLNTSNFIKWLIFSKYVDDFIK